MVLAPVYITSSADLGKTLGSQTPGVLLLVPFFGKQLESSFSLGFIGYYFLYHQTKTFNVLAPDELVHDAMIAAQARRDQEFFRCCSVMASFEERTFTNTEIFTPAIALPQIK
jgi:hypothetical protein